MVSPAVALLWFAGLVVLVAVVVWPRVGLTARLAAGRRMRERVRIEDALKQILNGELAGQAATVASLAGVLQISRGRAHDLVSLLAEQGFARSDERGLCLTEDGRSYALRILRTHRLLERYFADRTGVTAAEWHDRAEAEEHVLTPAEADALSARMGHPAYDPHGDPIPTAAGELPPTIGVPVTALAPGEAGTIVHVEDEPPSVYRRLLGLGVNLSVPVKMIRVEGNSVDLLVGGMPARLDPLMASAVSVARVTEEAGHTVRFDRLDVLDEGERATVVEIAPAIQGPQRRRLLDLGVLPGTVIEAEMRSPSGDPMAYRIRGALIALRRAQAHGIYVTREPAATGAQE